MNQREVNRQAIVSAIHKKGFDKSFVETCRKMCGGRWDDDMTMKEFREKFAPNGLRFAYATSPYDPKEIENMLQIVEDLFGEEFDIRPALKTPGHPTVVEEFDIRPDESVRGGP
jgi:hypothetical protein